MGPVLLLVGLGVLARRLRWLPASTPAALDRFAITLCLPAFAVVRLHDIALSADMAVPVAVAWIQLVVCAALVVEIGRIRGWSRPTLGAMLLVVPLANTSFVGLPLVESLLGAASVGPAVVYDQLGTFLALATYGSVIAARYGGAEDASPGAIARRVVTFPPFLGMVAGLALHGVDLDALAGGVVSDVLGRLGGALVPVVLVSVGMRIGLPRSRAVLEPMGVALAIRLVVIPAAVFAVAAALHARNATWDAVRLQSAMPPMISAGVMATDAGLDHDVVGAVVGLGLALGLATVWAWSTLL